jgi:phosphatidylglycerophosphate synthase
MFSESARARLVERGWSVSSLAAFFKDSAVESWHNARRRGSHVHKVVLLASAVFLATVALAVPVYGGGAVARFSAWVALATAGLTAWVCAYVGLMDAAGVGAANYLTLIRFYLIAPVLLFFDDGHHAASLAFYVALASSDVADGVVARARGERSRFGVVMDPLADVFSTAAVFGVFLAHGLVPPWLFLLLMARYAMLIVGSLVLFLAVGPIRFKATIPGKVVGVVQSAGVILVIVCALAGGDWLERISPVLFPVLGLAFASIVVSQLVIGVRHVVSTRRKAVEVES